MKRELTDIKTRIARFAFGFKEFERLGKLGKPAAFFCSDPDYVMGWNANAEGVSVNVALDRRE